MSRDPICHHGAAADRPTLGERRILLRVATRAIAGGFESGRLGAVEIDHFAKPLHRVQASFVTLWIGGRLRGCLGTIEPRHPLVVDVHRNAFAVAFSNSFFPVLEETEFPGLTISVSVLADFEDLSAATEQQLIRQLRPGTDGLVIRSGNRVATFLPSVWELLPEAEVFLQRLRVKAGLPLDAWPQDLEVRRYTASSFSTLVD